MLQFLWNEIFFRPLLNLLVGLYNTVGLENLGLAIIWLTVVTRIALLPFSLKAELERKKREELSDELAELNRSFANNPSVLREEQRALLRRKKFRRWPRVLSLGIQGFILLVLYQVFVGGINLSEIVDQLYAFVDVPLAVNTTFLGIDVADRSVALSLLSALILAFSIILDQGGIRTKWTNRDLLLLIGFPLGTFVILYLLPNVKALFIITSQVFSLALRFLIDFFRSVTHQQKLIDEKKKADAGPTPGVPHPKERFK